MIRPGTIELTRFGDDQCYVDTIVDNTFPETLRLDDPPGAFPEMVMLAAVRARRIEVDLLEDDVAEALRLQDFDKIDQLHIVEHRITLDDSPRIPPVVASWWPA